MKSIVALSLLLLVAANAELFHEPASGYYVCGRDLVCKVAGCTDCSVLANDFSVVSSEDGISTYTATSDGANLSILAKTESSAILCDKGCQCQSITASAGCGIPTSDMNALFPGGLGEKSGGDVSLSQAQQDESSAATSISVRNWMVGLAMTALVIPAFAS